MELDTANNSSLWKDRVALEMNAAVLHSFQKSGATIVDQHTVSEQFQTHLRNELRERGGCPADWVWLTPSQSGSLTPLYHQEMLHYHLSPSFERQDVLWETYRYLGLKMICKYPCNKITKIYHGLLLRVHIFTTS